MDDEVVAVIENRPLAGGHFLLSLHSPRQARATRPGQFAMVRLLGRSELLLRRPMSIYDVALELEPAPRGLKRGAIKKAGSAAGGRSPREPAIIQILYKIVGRGTRRMAELKPGDSVGLLAPLGHGFFEEEYMASARQADEVLLVAGGIGIAALLMPAKRLAAQGIKTCLFFGGRTRDDLAGMNDFEPLVRKMFLATENGSLGDRGYVTEPLSNYLERHERERFLLMVCGPWPMLAASVALAQKYGHPCLVSMENRMGCGLGVCLGCCIRVDGTGHGAYQRVCTEGPVFWAEKVVWGIEEGPNI